MSTHPESATANAVPLRPIVRCPRCQQRGQTWRGDAPKCAFTNSAFSSDNWNCATMTALRDLCADHNTVWNEDQNACLLSGADDCHHVVLTWYKRRGRTEGAWMLFDDRPPQPLTLKVAEQIITANTPDQRAETRKVTP